MKDNEYLYNYYLSYFSLTDQLLSAPIEQIIDNFEDLTFIDSLMDNLLEVDYPIIQMEEARNKLFQLIKAKQISDSSVELGNSLFININKHLASDNHSFLSLEDSIENLLIIPNKQYDTVNLYVNYILDRLVFLQDFFENIDIKSEDGSPLEADCLIEMINIIYFVDDTFPDFSKYLINQIENNLSKNNYTFEEKMQIKKCLLQINNLVRKYKKSNIQKRKKRIN